ncbi:MAG: hypothetical protein AB7I36_06590 [Rhodospirillaceae bacterium]
MRFTEGEIERSAILLAQRYGAEALPMATRRLHQLAKADDSVGAGVWQMIVTALEKIERRLH